MTIYKQLKRDMFVPLLLISHLLISGFASSFTNLQASHEFACMGETATFSCTTSHLFLIWTVTFADRTIASKTQFFRQTDSLKSLTKLVRGQQLHFQLTSTANGVIESILNVIQASPLMTNATIQCEGSAISRFKFKFASAPGIPTDIALNNETHYGSTLANVTLTWEGPSGRVDKYNVNVSTTESSTFNLSFSMTESRLTLEGVPYNDDIIVTVSTVNCVTESEKVNISFVISGCNLTYSAPLNGRFYSSSQIGMSNGVVASDEQLWLRCEPGFYPRDAMVARCQDDGLWYPDPSKVDCLRECFLPTTISNLKLIRRDSGGNTSNFNIVLRCKDGFSSVDDWMAVCSNGSWIPDLDEIECHNITAVIPNNNITISAGGNNTDYLHYIIAGSVVGSAMLLAIIVVCGFFIGVMIYCCKKSATSSQASADLPVYEYITNPVYECVNPKVTPVMTENEAYTTNFKELRAYEIV